MVKEKQMNVLKIKNIKMKNKLLLLLLFVAQIQMYFSQEYPLNTSPSDVSSYGYIKDINGELNKYVGLWKGNWNGKTVYIELKKNKKLYAGSNPYYIDEIAGERKIVNSNGIVEIDRISNFDNQNPEFWGLATNLKNPSQKSLIFFMKNMCNKKAQLNITDFTNLIDINTGQLTPQMTLQFEYLPSIYDESCIHNTYVQQHGDFPINFPKDIVLTKQ